MRHTNSVFHDILKLVPWAAFDRLVDEYGTDEAARRFTTRNQFLALLFAQLGGASSLREVEAVMASHQARLYHSGAKAPKRSTFADANRNRDPRVFSKLFEHMLAASPRGFRRKMGDAVRLIDSTSLAGPRRCRMGALLQRRLRRQGAYHLRSGPRPPGLSCGHGRQRQRHHRRQADADHPDATDVFDLGYYDFSWWAQLDGAGCRLVTRFKANTPLREAKDMPLAVGSDVLSDRIGFLPARQGNNRKNPMQDAVREIVVETETGKRLRILTNDLDAPAQEIANLYKRRWQIELFFRVMKHTENHQIPRTLRKRRADLDRRRAHRFLAAPPAARRHQSNARLPRTHSTLCAPI